MEQYKNIAITGAKGAGKSTLANWLLERMGRSCAGFRTEKYGQTPAGPLYALRDILTDESAPISQYRDGSIRGISESFDGFGVQVLNAALASPAPVMLLDEIGRFERSSGDFLEGVFSALDSKKTVIVVLKKEELPHIEGIKGRSDTLLLDLDLLSKEASREILVQWLEQKRISF